MSDERNEHFRAFRAANGDQFADEFLEILADMLWNHEKERGQISIIDVHQINACNHVLTGTLQHDGEEIGFSIEMGDINGCVVHSWGDDDEPYQPPKPVVRRFVPKDDDLRQRRPDLWKAYLMWRMEDWFIEKERAMNYDHHFAPGEKTYQHYSEWAAKKGMKIEVADD